jgi:heme/copper-type cytochrome/quinol oxidase subunit 3
VSEGLLYSAPCTNPAHQSDERERKREREREGERERERERERENKTEMTISHKSRGVVLYIISPYCLFRLLGLTFLELKSFRLAQFDNMKLTFLSLTVLLLN